MADKHNPNKQVPPRVHVDVDVLPLPRVLVLGDKLIYTKPGTYNSHKFHLQYLSCDTVPSHPHQHRCNIASSVHDPSSVRAVLWDGGCAITADVLRHLPSVGLVVTPSAGTDHIDLRECRRRGVQVANAGSVFSEDVADMAVGLMIDVMTKISAKDRFVRSRVRPPGNFPLGPKLGGKRVGIVGLGNIGLEVAKRLDAFGCIISYHSKNRKPSVSYPFYSNIVKLAADCNALVICCALKEETRHIINKEVMLALGKEGVIVNVGRGALVDEKVLVQLLMEGKIGGAGLDVFENEPHVPKELFALDNVVLSSHAASFTSDSHRAVIELVGQNLEAFFSNQPLITPVIVD